jgi:hypothetical protein
MLETRPLCTAAGTSYGDVERMLQQLQLSYDSLPATDDSPAPFQAAAAAAAALQAAAPGGSGPHSRGSSGSEFRSPMSSVGGGQQGGGGGGAGGAAGSGSQSQSWSETLRELGISVSQDLGSPGSEAGSGVGELGPVEE